MQSIFLVGTVNLGIAFLALLSFLIGDTLVSSLQTIGQYFSFDVFVYSFSGGTHWANVLIKHIVPIVIGVSAYLIVARWFLRLNDEDQAASASVPNDIEASVAVGLFVGALVTAWPSIRFPQLLLFEYNFALLLFSAFLFCVSFSISGVIGVRLGRALWHPPTLEAIFADNHSIIAWRKAAGPIVIAVATGALGSVFATVAGG